MAQKNRKITNPVTVKTANIAEIDKKKISVMIFSVLAQ